jgi:hypothetical protein
VVGGTETGGELRDPVDTFIFSRQRILIWDILTPLADKRGHSAHAQWNAVAELAYTVCRGQVEHAACRGLLFSNRAVVS